MSANSLTSTQYSPGLEGIIAGETAISSVEHGLQYRGYPVQELADHATFDEVAYLLLHGELPTTTQLEAFCQRIYRAMELPPLVLNVLSSLPQNTTPLDVLRSGVSLLAHFDPDTEDLSVEANLRKAERLLGQIPVLIASHFRLARHQSVVPPRADLRHAANFLWMLQGKEATPQAVKAFDVSLLMYAEHEFNASTFTARTIISTESDLHSAVVGAIGALKGRLHGGANEKVMEVLRAAGGPATAADWLRGLLARKERIMGFGHRVYKTGDVRAGILKTYARAAAAEADMLHWEETAEIIERIMAEEKNLFPNLDWPAGRLYHALGLEIPIYTPIFAMARITGWSAHVMEQASKNRLIRPRGLYVGPAQRTVRPIHERG